MNIKISVTMSEVRISKEQLINSYKTADNETKKTLEAIFGKEMFKPKDIKERIKTFEDARSELGSAHPLVEEYETITCRCGGLSADILAYMKLRIIAAALNEGWEPQFAEDEWRYFPWFYLYTQKEIDEMDEEEKARVVFRSGSVAFAYGGVAFAYAGSGSSSAGAVVGSRLAFKSSELAKYAGEQFVEIWADYVFKPDEKQGK